ncbi:MAG: T9SS type A sorting domain-containing protein [candidate division Zixibacteria bacterium]|nr:T9SS type A sorting domain-containing protein [candidate division Zixibacteria bacterium]
MLKSILLITAISTSAAFGSTIDYSVNLDKPLVSASEEIISKSGFNTTEAGKPAIPFECYRFVIPFGEKVDNVDVTFNEFTVIDDDIDILQAQLPEVIGQGRRFTPKDETIYNSDGSYPNEDYRFVDVDRLGGVDIATVCVYPYKYNPIKREFGFYQKVAFEIVTSPDIMLQNQQSKMICKSSQNLFRIKQIAENPEVVNSYPDMNIPSSTQNLVDPLDPNNFLIITSSAYLTTFNNYASWKESHGISAAVYTIEDIYAEYTEGADNAENLRAFIIDAYQTWANSTEPLQYVLLAGDDEIIPVRGCWGYTVYFDTDYHIPCDIYYGTLDGDWNANGNQYYGEPDDDPDLYAEVHVGRFPGDNLQDFQNMINKIQHHVENPPENIYTSLMVGEQLDANPDRWGGDYLDYICDNPEFLPIFYDNTTMYDKDGTFSTAAVTQHINNNQSMLVHHCAHCNWNYLLGWGPYDLDDLVNTEYPFFTSGGCHTMAFEQGTSGNTEAVGEHAMFADGGMMAYWGHSRYGFGYWVYYIQELMVGIYTEQIKSIGASITYSRDQMVPYALIDDIYRWEFYELIYAGDPEVQLVYGVSEECLACKATILTKRVPDVNGTIQFEFEVANCGTQMINVFGEMYPTVGDCTSGSQYDLDINRLIVPFFNTGGYLKREYYYDVGNVGGSGLSHCALNFDVGPSTDNWIATCCDDFYFSQSWDRKGSSQMEWGTEWKDYIDNEPTTIPSAAALHTNYPNPFNANTQINYTVGSPSTVELKVYNIKGQLVETLVNEQQNPGKYSIDWNASMYSSGVYFYKLNAGGQLFTKRMTLLK